tara:strand:+ start:120 stop:458 length:339 start_codon:yes stop_codon:yes gene_type:complete
MLNILTKEEINGEELEELLLKRDLKETDFLLVDVREEYEFNNKKIIGVDYLIPMSVFFDKMNVLEQHKTKVIITQCKVGGRSLKAQQILKAKGFEKVINLAGGILKYKGKTT